MSGQVLLREPDADLDRPDPHRDRRRQPSPRRRAGGLRRSAHLRIDGPRPPGRRRPDEPSERIPSQVAHIARDPIDPLFDDEKFLRALARKDTTIKRALLDQTLVSGIGNIYADEALWAARVHYDQPTRSLSRPRAKALLAEVRLVLGRALAEGGTSFSSTYVNVNGASGYFSHSLNAYGQHGHPCQRCGRPIVRESFMNRGSHFCPFCQRVRAPR